MDTANRIKELAAQRHRHGQNAVGFADDTKFIAPRQIASRLHFHWHRKVLDPIFVPEPGTRVVVHEVMPGRVTYTNEPMVDSFNHWADKKIEELAAHGLTPTGRVKEH